MMEKEKIINYIWVEKYRPKNLDEIILPNFIKQKIKKWIEENQIPNLLFIGPAGVGKSSLLKIICNSLNCDFLILNLSDERGIDTIRNKIKVFATTYSEKPLKVLGLDEFDFCTPEGQAALRNLIESTSKYCRYILTANYENKIIDPIKSRTMKIEFKDIDKNDFINYLANICKKEKINYNENDLKKLMLYTYPDLRKAINILQQISFDNKININLLDEKIIDPTKYILKLIKEKNYKELHNFLIKNEIDLLQVARKMFDYYLKNEQVEKCLIINDEFLKLVNFVPFPKILFLSMVIKLF